MIALYEAGVRRNTTHLEIDPLTVHFRTTTFQKWFRGGLVVKARRLLYHSTLGLRDIKKNKKTTTPSSRLTASRYHSRAEMCSGSETVAYLRLIDSCITQLKAQGPPRTCNESKEEEEATPERAGNFSLILKDFL